MSEDIKRIIPENAGLILEGGGSRGVFTAGILDYFMEKNLYFPYVVGVSAGACNALDYRSEQPYRTRDTFIIRDKALHPINPLNIPRIGYIYDMDLPFYEYPHVHFPFDFETYKNSEMKCEMVVTDIDTGRAEYLSEDKDDDRILNICRASSTLPFLAPPVTLDGKRYMDGGLADSIPYARSMKLGYKKHVVILTQQEGYRKKQDKTSDMLVRTVYGKEKALVRTCIRRPGVYNRQLDILKRLEDEGRIFVIRPTEKTVKRLESDLNELDRFYQHGYNTAVNIFDEMMAYLNK
ncbi:MAG: patatin family protein [Lachnospiraceae bacterium]|nr:patatin family protein [Lachnospiraceae bacterium]